MMMEFRILRANRRVKSKLATLACSRTDFSLLKDLLGIVLWGKDPVKKGGS